MNEQAYWQDYLATRSPEAFRQIVDRYAPIVYGSAVRQLRNRTSAEDVTQAVFILLARKATQVPADRPLSGWLLKTTRYVAANARREALRRRNHEHKAGEMNRPDPPTADDVRMQQEISEKLDESLVQLREGDRNAILLRFFESRTFNQIAASLDISEDAAEKRVSRAVDRLRSIFVRKGSSVNANVLGSFLALHLTQTPPASLTAAVLANAHALSLPHSLAPLVKGSLSMKAIALSTGLLLATSTLLVAGSMKVMARLDAPNTSVASAPPSPPPTTAPIDDHSLMTTYQLPANEVVRIVQDQPPSVRKAMWAKLHANQMGMTLPDIAAMPFAFNWNDGKPINPTTIEAEGAVLPKSRVVELLATAVLGVRPWEFEATAPLPGDPFLVNGDVVYTDQLPIAKSIPALQAAISKELGLNVKLNLATVNRKVFVLKGTWSYHPVPEAPANGPIMVNGQTINPMIRAYGTELLGTESHSVSATMLTAPPIKLVGKRILLGWLSSQTSEWIGNRQVIFEADGDLPEQLGWSGYEPTNATPDELAIAHDPALVLKHIAEQTGLTLSEETRSVRRLIVTQ